MQATNCPCKVILRQPLRVLSYRIDHQWKTLQNQVLQLAWFTYPNRVSEKSISSYLSGLKTQLNVPPVLETDTLEFLSPPKPQMEFNSWTTAFWRLPQSMAAIRWCVMWRTVIELLHAWYPRWSEERVWEREGLSKPGGNAIHRNKTKDPGFPADSDSLSEISLYRKKQSEFDET